MATAFDTVKAIPATYSGITFRSRLEARYAVLFDQLGVPWQYEADGRQLASGWYLPDFRLPRAGLWVEIKPKAPTSLEVAKCRELCAATGNRVLLAYGDFGWWLPDRGCRDPLSAICLSPSMDPDGEVVCFGEDHDYEPCLCPVCGEFGFEFEGRGARICARTTKCCGDSDRCHTSDSPRILEAVEKAEKWSFWR